MGPQLIVVGVIVGTYLLWESLMMGTLGWLLFWDHTTTVSHTYDIHLITDWWGGWVEFKRW